MGASMLSREKGNKMKKNHNIEIAEQVLRVRLGQMLINEKYKSGEFKIPIHLALGHEAIAVSVDSIMEKNDNLILSHRNIHYNLAREKALKPEIDEYYLKEEGLSKGQLGSMNLANEKKGIVYTSSILGNNLPVATGVALSKKVKNEDGIVIVETGDGAIEEGSFYESLVFLKSNELPILVIIENNEWSLATRIKERRCDIDIKKLTESIDIKYELLDSNNTYEYVKKLKNLRKYAISNKTPVCIEVKLTTLGSWYLKTDEYPNGKFINYHAGPAPTVNVKDGALMKESLEDPVFVLQEYFSKKEVKEISRGILKKLEEEIK